MNNSKNSSKRTNDGELEHPPKKRVMFEDENDDRIIDHDIKEEKNIRKLIIEENLKDEQGEENYQNKDHSKKFILDQVDKEFFMKADQKNLPQLHCFLCGKYFKNSYHWIRHIKASDKCNFQCIVCNQSKVNTNWNLHQLRCLNILKRIATTGFIFKECKRKKDKKNGKYICVAHNNMSEHMNLQNRIIKKATEEELQKESNEDNQIEENSDETNENQEIYRKIYKTSTNINRCEKYDESILKTKDEDLKDIKLKLENSKVELTRVEELYLVNEILKIRCNTCDKNLYKNKRFTKCDNCDKSFLSALSDAKFKYARIELIKDDLNLKNDELQLICKSCDEDFCTYKNFKKHINEEKLHCKLCDKGFCKYEQLARHQKIEINVLFVTNV